MKKMFKKLGKAAGSIINKKCQRHANFKTMVVEESAEIKKADWQKLHKTIAENAGILPSYMTTDTRWYLKKPPYHVHTFCFADFWFIELRRKNNFALTGHSYGNKRVAVQQAKRLAKALGLEYRT